MPIELRPARVEDVPLVLALIRELAEYERAPNAVHATEGMIAQALFPAAGAPTAECTIGLIDGVAQGFALYFHNFSSWVGKRGLYLEDLFVRPGARGRGLGKALLERVAQIAVERGCDRLDWVVVEWNTPAVEFYTRMGAKAQSEWTIFRAQGGALEVMAKGDE